MSPNQDPGGTLWINQHQTRSAAVPDYESPSNADGGARDSGIWNVWSTVDAIHEAQHANVQEQVQWPYFPANVPLRVDDHQADLSREPLEAPPNPLLAATLGRSSDTGSQSGFLEPSIDHRPRPRSVAQDNLKVALETRESGSRYDLPVRLSSSTSSRTVSASSDESTSGASGRQWRDTKPVQSPNSAVTQVSTASLVRGAEKEEYMVSELSILSAEHFDDGFLARRAQIKLGAPGSDATTGSKKKKRGRGQVVSDNDEDLEEDKKRPRGRPRLDTQDETAQDRRRTQIRHAQRAYRQRKDGAITKLQEQVDGLKDANDRMSQAYQELFDYSTRKGLLNSAPDFAERLLKIQELARLSASHSTSDGEKPVRGGSDEPTKAPSNRSSRSSPSKKAAMPEPTANPRKEQEQEQEQTQTQPTPRLRAGHQQRDNESQPNLWAGLLVTHEPDQEAVVATDTSSDSNLALVSTVSNGGYEFLTEPTLENSSYPTTQNSGLPNQWMSQPSPWARTLPAPDDLSFQELTFSRRLQRAVLQCGTALLSMQHPPPEKLMRAFGIARLFESYDQIRARTQTMLGQTTTETLNYWNYPFHHIAGAGTHFPNQWQSSSDPKLNRLYHGVAGSASGARHGFSGANFAMGPFDAKTTKDRDSFLPGQRLSLPGFEGKFWDAEEVTYYLQHNGVHIPPGADWLETEIAEGAFGQPPENIPIEMATPTASTSANGVHGLASSMPTASTSDLGSFSGMSSSSPHASTRISTPNSSSHDLLSGLPASAPAADESWTLLGAGSGAPTEQPSGQPTSFSHGLGLGALAAFADNSVQAYTDPTLMGFAPAELHVAPRKRTVKINVSKLLGDLIGRATCLGRSPGFQPNDVDSAFWASIVVTTELR